jgi:hypothetical protein
LGSEGMFPHRVRQGTLSHTITVAFFGSTAWSDYRTTRREASNWELWSAPWLKMLRPEG